jgi:hypothetical protein
MYQSAGFLFTGEAAKPQSTRLPLMIKALDIRNTDREAF